MTPEHDARVMVNALALELPARVHTYVAQRVERLLAALAAAILRAIKAEAAWHVAEDRADALTARLDAAEKENKAWKRLRQDAHDEAVEARAVAEALRARLAEASGYFGRLVEAHNSGKWSSVTHAEVAIVAACLATPTNDEELAP